MKAKKIFRKCQQVIILDKLHIQSSKYELNTFKPYNGAEKTDLIAMSMANEEIYFLTRIPIIIIESQKFLGSEEYRDF